MASTPQEPTAFFWEKFSQSNPDGRRVIRLNDRTEIELLYRSGFVDVDRFTLEDWTEAFRDSRQPDGAYLLTEPQWAEKKKYVYAGPVEDPFDPLSLREGEWDGKEFEALIMEKILPAVLADPEGVKAQFDSIFAKAAPGRRPEIDKVVKTEIQKVLDTHPSPRRLRELAFAGMKTRGRPLVETSFSNAPSASKTAQDKLSRLLSKGK